MSAYIAPVLNNGVLNTTFNSSDFEGTYPDSFLPLSGGNITGGLNVSENLGVSGAIDANDLTVSGNVGIGTTSPDADLHIYGGSNNTELFLGEDAAVDKCGILKYIQGNGNGTGSLQVGNWGDNFSYQAFCINKGGNVGVGTASPVAKFHIQGGSTGTLADTAVDGAQNRKYYYDTSIGLGETFSQSKTLGLFCGAYAAVRELTIGPWMTFTSDRRIKQNIVEIIDDDALQKLRLLKPCTYNYKDYMDNGANKVYGFIAQEVKEILPYAVNESTGPLSKIPNIYCFCDVSNNRIKLLKDSHYTDINGTAFGKSGSLGDLEKDANDNYFSLVFIDNNEGEVVKNIVDIVDDTTFVIDSPFNEEQLVDGKIFLFGQKVTNFNFLNKNAIWTLATAALQEVDRQLQAEKVKTATLESQVAALLVKYPVI